MGMSPQDYEYLLVAVRVPRTQSDRSRLIAQAGCSVASRRTAISSSCRPLTAPPSRCLIAPSGCCAASRCAAVSSSCRATLSSSHCATLSLSHRAIWLLHFYGTTCRHRRTANKLPPTSQCHAATTATATTLLPPRCHRRAVRRHRSATAKLPPTSRCRAAATASPPPSCCKRPRSRCRHRRSCCTAAAALPPPSCRRPRAAATAAVRWLVVALLSAVRFCHRMPSCDHQRSRCRPLSPINCLPPPPPPPWSNSPLYIGEESAMICW